MNNQKASRRTFFKYMMAAALGAGLSRSSKTSAATCTAEDPCPYYLPFVSRPRGITNIIFLHHSTGYNLIHQGNVRPLFTGMGYSFWDHDYNSPGLSRPDGSLAGYNYNVPDDNTNPDGFNNIFQQTYYSSPSTGAPANCFSGLMRHQVIIFKSCFPASAIYSDQMLEDYKTYYKNIKTRVQQFSQKIFIPFSPPPLHPCATDAGEASRARAFANWLKSPEYLGTSTNIFPFDFFDYLARPVEAASEANMLKPEYRPGYCDSHPNELANQTIGPIFVNFVDAAIKAFES